MTTMIRHSRVFFSEARAFDFMDWLLLQGMEDVEIWSGKGAFNQPEYTVRWSTEEEKKEEK